MGLLRTTAKGGIPRILLYFSVVSVAAAAVIDGVVVENGSGRPLARTRVALQALRGGGHIPLKTALTDSSGHFSFSDLDGEAYLLEAQRAAYLTGRYGQRRWNGAGTPIVVGQGGRFFAEIRLRRLGAVSGEILDENQVGLAGVPVGAWRAGSQPMRIMGSATSDDRGAFRIAGLEPGDYYVLTGAFELEDRSGLLPTYFGQTGRLQDARVVKVQLDSEYSGVRIEPLAGRLGRLNGQVTGGGPVLVMLFGETGKRDAAPGGDGRFTFDRLAPGEYELIAQGGSAAAWRRIWVSEGVTSLALELGSPPVVTVRAESANGNPVAAGAVHVALNRLGLSKDLPAPAVTGDQPETVLPGEYSAWASAPQGQYVEALRIPARAGTADRFTASPGQPVEINVILSSQPSKLRGSVRTADGAPAIGAPVFLLPSDPELRARMGGARTARAGEDGTYEFQDLPPGNYLVLCTFDFDSPDEVDWRSPQVRTVPIEEGRETSLDLSPVSIP